ncbi:hypothetical protein GobsT_73870 [Gemmata obscuriglobus]|uniref:Uncharacterized protein n=1 Tax=Gemmata obscuriglobus TaxID=114 RepID=A0A2Z3H6B7_9BACT|nr:hypothetical protein [Gemmata obscuriglobus]AWM41553.1 hypothetical protein C1280_34165 [Gemmata obscuriglobus]QEG32532.1 hypothetical protein GobsT_73870 [Gemmata obscuriglobus]VTS11888.1 Uncharacterized protein OS=Solibacter usitatus (strain Ellin6076) GN=Acid_6913 PE=4 SV=1 [Gemmata obscuriglobus UQM 2246]
MQLATYLNDHLSGSTAALELLEHLEKAHADLVPFLKALRHDIEFDRKELESLIARLGARQSASRQAVAWVAEKFARLKMTVDDLSGGRLKLLESLEAVAIGIHGKGALWRALKFVPAASGPDYDLLARRADEQRERLEPVRLDAARRAFEG